MYVGHKLGVQQPFRMQAQPNQPHSRIGVLDDVVRVAESSPPHLYSFPSTTIDGPGSPAARALSERSYSLQPSLFQPKRAAGGTLARPTNVNSHALK
jgi:hypothetical protein